MKLDPRRCESCSEKFVPVRRIQKYCSPRCKNREAMRRLVARSHSSPGKPVQGGKYQPRPKVSPQGREMTGKGIVADPLIITRQASLEETFPNLMAFIEGKSDLEVEEAVDPWSGTEQVKTEKGSNED